MNSTTSPSAGNANNETPHAPVRLQFSEPLYGRSREQHALAAALKRAAAGGAELVVISGPAGIGKTALVQRMRTSLSSHGGYFIAGKFDQLQRNLPFRAVVAALHDLVRQLLSESQAQARAWRDAIVATAGRNGRVITEVVPCLERIIGPQPPLPPLEPTESQNRFNHVFQGFLQVFCRDNRPLVMFLDDVQWADPASLKLLVSLLSAAGTHSLLVIASARDNEVAATHPFTTATRELERRAVPVSTVRLSALGWSDIAQLVGDTLHIEGEGAAKLAEIIREKTAGNPFFIQQFLQTLRTEVLTARDGNNGSQRCDLAAVRALAITENVADLVAQKLDRLEAETLRIVSIGAAIGNHFDLATLAAVAGDTPQNVGAMLSAAVRDQLLTMPDNSVETAGTSLYAFHHDRIQQAAYARLPADKRAAVSLAIGRVMLAACGDDPGGALFEIVSQMNQGMSLIDGRQERLRLARLNLLAATRARNSTAYDLASRSCRSAIDLLGWDAWGEHHGLAFEAHLRLAECQALMADFEGAFSTVESALANARATADRGRLLTVRTHTYLSMGDMTGAVACARQAAQLFGLELPERADLVRSRLTDEIGAILAWSAATEIESLLDLPVMTDPDHVVLMSLLMHCIPPAYQVNPELFALICCKMVRLSIEHGNCPMSAKGYGSFAAILSGIVGNFRDGDRFGKLGVDLCARLNDVSVRSACHFTWAAFASAWVRPVDESIRQFREGVRWGLSSGDHPHAAYSASVAITHVMFRGATLAEVRAQADEALHLLQRIGDSINIALLRSRRRLADWLLRTDCGNSLDSDDFEEAAMLRELQVASVSKSMLAHFQSLRVVHRFFLGDHAEAWRISQQLDELLVFVPGMMTVVEHAFYQSLTVAALWNQAPHAQRASLEDRLALRLRSLDAWAQSCPENFAAMQSLVAAELARIRSDSEAGALFDRAIVAARANGFTHVEALACELASNYWRTGDTGRSAALREQAIGAYRAWGAHRKVLALGGTAAC